MLTGITVAVFAYFLGSISFSILVAKMFGVTDIRKHGSGNAGSTNVLRVAGKKAAAITFVCDFLKGVVPVIAAHLICFEYKFQFVLISAFMAVIGHIFPAYFDFRGGKGVATSFGAVIAMSVLTGEFWIPFVLLGIWLVIVVLTGYVSLGSIIAFAVYPVMIVILFSDMMVLDYASYIAFSVVVGGLGIFMHRKNISRLIHGKESKIGQKSK